MTSQGKTEMETLEYNKLIKINSLKQEVFNPILHKFQNPEQVQSCYSEAKEKKTRRIAMAWNRNLLKVKLDDPGIIDNPVPLAMQDMSWR